MHRKLEGKPILTIWLGLAFLTSFMIFSKSAVSSACFWVCKAIFSLNFLGFDMAMADKLAVALLLWLLKFLSQCLQRPSHHLVLQNHYRGLWIVNYAPNNTQNHTCLALGFTRPIQRDQTCPKVCMIQFLKFLLKQLPVYVLESSCKFCLNKNMYKYSNGPHRRFGAQLQTSL